MKPGRVLLDTAIFVYAVGADHEMKAACLKLLEPRVLNHYGGEASVQAIQELLHQRARRTGNRQQAAEVAGAMAGLCPLHPITAEDLRTGLLLFREHSALSGRDALHAATALNRGISTIVSPDRDFDRIEGLTRLDPLDAAHHLVP